MKSTGRNFTSYNETKFVLWIHNSMVLLWLKKSGNNQEVTQHNSRIPYMNATTQKLYNKNTLFVVWVVGPQNLKRRSGTHHPIPIHVRSVNQGDLLFVQSINRHFLFLITILESQSKFINIPIKWYCILITDNKAFSFVRFHFLLFSYLCG